MHLKQFRDLISKYVVHIFPDLSIDYIFISNINVSHKNLEQVLGIEVIELKMRKILSYIPWNKMTRKTDERLQEEPEKQQRAVRLLILPLNVDACPRVWLEHQIHNPFHTGDGEETQGLSNITLVNSS